MQLFYEIFPVFLFFLAFKLYGIYVATIVGMVTTAFQVVFGRLWFGKWDRKQLITLAVFFLFGSMTLYFHDPIFVKWKPTIVFWIFALLILGSQFMTPKPVTQRLMENMLQQKKSVPVQVWKRLNLVWALFFLVLGGANLYVAYSLSNNAWVNFKFYGITGAFFVLAFFQACYLMRFMSEDK